MKIAIETDDGVHLSSQKYETENFQILEIPENSFLENLGSEKTIVKRINKKMLTNSTQQNENILKELTNCSAVISHGMNRSLSNNLKNSKVDVFISFRANIDEALNDYLKDRIIHNFSESN